MSVQAHASVVDRRALAGPLDLDPGGRCVAPLEVRSLEGIPRDDSALPGKARCALGFVEAGQAPGEVVAGVSCEGVPRGVSESTIEACLRDRARSKAPRDADRCSLLAKYISAYEMVKDLVDEEDRDDVKKTVEEMVEARTGKRKAAEATAKPAEPSRAAPSSSSGAASSSCPAPSRQVAKRPVPEGVHHESEVQHLKPPVTGAVLSKDSRRFMRWTASYPGDTPPRSCSKVWTLPGWSERRSFLYALQWLWLCHRAATGEDWPRRPSVRSRRAVALSRRVLCGALPMASLRIAPATMSCALRPPPPPMSHIGLVATLHVGPLYRRGEAIGRGRVQFRALGRCMR